MQIFGVFLSWVNQAVQQTVELPLIWDALLLTWRPCNVNFRRIPGMIRLLAHDLQILWVH